MVVWKGREGPWFLPLAAASRVAFWLTTFDRSASPPYGSFAQPPLFVLE